MTNDELAALRTLIREEVNAAVYASEQRIGEPLNRLEGGQRELRLDVARIEVQLSETISVLNDASRVINDLQFSQRALETKVEENLLGLRRDMQRLTESVHTLLTAFHRH